MPEARVTLYNTSINWILVYLKGNKVEKRINYAYKTSFSSRLYDHKWGSPLRMELKLVFHRDLAHSFWRKRSLKCCMDLMKTPLSVHEWTCLCTPEVARTPCWCTELGVHSQESSDFKVCRSGRKVVHQEMCTNAVGGLALGISKCFLFMYVKHAKTADELKLELFLLPHAGEAFSVLTNRLCPDSCILWSSLHFWLLWYFQAWWETEATVIALKSWSA